MMWLCLCAVVVLGACTANVAASPASRAQLARRQLPPAPTGVPGDPNYEGWEQISCDYGSLTSAYNNPWQQWRDAGASAAYHDAVDADPDVTSWPNQLADFFHARPGIGCDILDNANCEVTVSCGQGAVEPNGDVSAPAGYMVINSMVNLHMIFDDLWHGINDALPLVLADVGSFVETMSPIVQDIEDQRQSKLALDYIQMAFFITIAPTFHSVFTRTAWWVANPNVAGTLVDVTYGMVGTAMATAKDAMEAMSTLPVQNQISSYISGTVLGWLEIVTDTAEKLFNDKDALFTLIDRGQLFAADAQSNPLDVLNAMRKNLFASTLRAVWTSGNEPGYPVLITSGGGVVPQDGTGCDSWSLEEETDEFHYDFVDDVLSTSRLCEGDIAYWLVIVKPAEIPQTCCTSLGGCNICGQRYGGEISTPPGWDTLNGTAWGGLTKDDVFWNTLNQWKANGYRNGFNTAFEGIDDPAAMRQLISGDLKQNRGVVNIPVCDFSQIAETVASDPDNTQGNGYYPCPP